MGMPSARARTGSRQATGPTSGERSRRPSPRRVPSVMRMAKRASSAISLGNRRSAGEVDDVEPTGTDDETAGQEQHRARQHSATEALGEEHGGHEECAVDEEGGHSHPCAHAPARRTLAVRRPLNVVDARDRGSRRSVARTRPGFLPSSSDLGVITTFRVRGHAAPRAARLAAANASRSAVRLRCRTAMPRATIVIACSESTATPTRRMVQPDRDSRDALEQVPCAEDACNRDRRAVVRVPARGPDQTLRAEHEHRPPYQPQARFEAHARRVPRRAPRIRRTDGRLVVVMRDDHPEPRKPGCAVRRCRRRPTILQDLGTVASGRGEEGRARGGSARLVTISSRVRHG